MTYKIIRKILRLILMIGISIMTFGLIPLILFVTSDSWEDFMEHYWSKY